MNLTDAQAKTKWCPQALAGKVVWEKCQTDACMAWRWSAVADNNSEWAKAERQKFAPNGRGYCGLAGRPE